VDKNLEDFIKLLMEPRPELSSLPICPYLKTYQEYIKYAEVESISDIIDNNPYIISNMNNVGSVFIYIIKQNITYDEIVNLWKGEQEKYNNDDIEFLFMVKDDDTIPPLRVLKNYSYKHDTLFILQRKTTLKDARNKLAKNTNYYDYWSRKE
jgi:hypothetical protein|tara:strand:+ start:351 stop:806 length:456 start_codon:yes stop_codon:yes gene_type:complete